MDFDYTFPYPSQRMPVLAANAVATSQPLAAQAGLATLQAGGNAIDACVTAAAMLTVVEPTANGLGADAFALVWAGGGLHGLNASGRSPARLDRAFFDTLDAVGPYGWSAVTTPGAISAWVELSNRFGKLPFERLLAPAIDYARRGYLVSPQTASGWANAARVYAKFESWQRTFCPAGRAPAAGELFRSEPHAQTLEQIAATRGEAFYRGALAERIVAAARAEGGWLSADDLAAHRAEWVRPISIEYHGATLNEIPPNGQGITALIALGILGFADPGDLAVDSPERLHIEIEATKLAFADARRYIADPAAMEIDPARLLDPAYLESRARLIDRDRAQDPGHGEPLRGGTVYLTTADAEGNMVSYIQSNYLGFGSGVVVDGTGIALQNRGACFVVERGHPNDVAPGKRPYHTIIPGFLTRGVLPVMSFGVMGGFMQPQGHVQVIRRLVDHRQNPQAAIDAPRWQIGRGLDVEIEPGFAPGVYEALSALGHGVTIAEARTVRHGGGQAIYRLADGYFAASDARRDGQAVGF